MNKKIVNKIYRRCIKIQNKNRRKHFTIFVSGNRILKISINKERTSHPVAKLYNHLYETKHSEFDVLKFDELKNIKIFNLRLDINNNVLKSTPCRYCAKLLKDLNIKMVYEITSDVSYKIINLDEI